MTTIVRSEFRYGFDVATVKTEQGFLGS